MSAIYCRVCGDTAYELQLCDIHLDEYHEWKRSEGDSTGAYRVDEYVDLCDENSRDHRDGVLMSPESHTLSLESRSLAQSPYVAERLAPKASDCTCFFSCGDDQRFACSKSGAWHQHSTEPCPVHPDAAIS